MIAPWLYTWSGGYTPPPPQTSRSSLEALWLQQVDQATGCSGSQMISDIDPYGGPFQTFDGIDRSYYLLPTYSRHYTEYSSSPCAATATQTLANTFIKTRSIYCPTGTIMYQAGPPVVGPYCQIPSLLQTLLANVPKQVGGPCCSNASSAPNSGGADSGSGRLFLGNPSDVSNGNKYEAVVDYAGGAAQALQFKRAYNSLVAYGWSSFLSGLPQPFGMGWMASYFQSLYAATVTDGTGTHLTVYAARPDGKVLTFVSYGGQLVGDPDVSDTLVQVTGGYQYHTAGDVIETYNQAGQLTQVVTRGGTAVTVTPTSVGPSSVSDAFGHSLTFAYNSDGTVSTITDPSGATILYGYGANHNLTSVQYEDGMSIGYAYGATGMVNSLTQETDEAGVQYATWTYDSGGSQVTGASHASGADSYSFSYSSSPNTRTVFDPLRMTRHYTHQTIQGVNRVTGVDALCAGCGEDASRTYDADGNIQSRTDFKGVQTTYVYDTDRNLETSRTEAYGTPRARTITTQWDPTWRQPALITEPNRTTSFTYDALGNTLTKTITDTTVTPTVSRTWTYTYDGFGHVLTADGPRTDVPDMTIYTYYSCTTGYQCGQLHTVTNAAGQVTTYNTYNANGQPLTITDPNGVVTTLNYDTRQRVTFRQFGSETTNFTYWPTGLLKRVTRPDGSYLQFTYDDAHRLTNIQDTLGNSITYELDAMGNRVAESTYDPSSTRSTTHSRMYNSLNELSQELASAGTAAVTTTFGYDGNGNQISIAAPMSRNVVNAYDELNRLKQITDPNSGVTQLSYDANDQPTTVTDPRQLVTSYVNNGFGEVTQQVSPDTGITTHTYDSAGSLKTTTDARGALGTYAYDALNRVRAIQFVKAGLSTVTKSFIYDNCTYGKGRLCERDDGVGITQWTYTPQGRIATRTETDGSSPNLASPPPGPGQYVIAYGYNANGQRTSLQMPSGSSVNYSYNSNGQVSGLSVTVAGVTTPILSSVTYEPFGAVKGWTWGNGASVIRSHDQDGNASVISTTGLHLRFQYDDAQRLTNLVDLDSAALTWSFSPDTLDRLASASDTAQSLGWSYDANGNRLTQTGTTAHSYTYDSASNRVLRRDLENTDELYDAAGNPQDYLNGEMMNFDAEGNLSYFGEVLNTNGARQRITAYSAVSSPDRLVFDDEGHVLGKYQVDGSNYPTLNLIAHEETIYLGDTPVAVLMGQASYDSNGDYLGTPAGSVLRARRPSQHTATTDPSHGQCARVAVGQ
jgi:YD repeat-containing protein